MITVGLIGGIASGKSEVARLLGVLGARTVDVDRVAHETYVPGTPGHAAIVSAFGQRVVAADGSIDRRALGGLVFGDPAQLKRLTDIVWPLTRRRLEVIKAEAAGEGVSVLLLEAAILIEAGWRDLVDEVWLVRTTIATAEQRLIERRGLSEADARARIAARTDLDSLAAQSDVIIDNDGSLPELEARVESEWRLLLRRAAS